MQSMTGIMAQPASSSQENKEAVKIYMDIIFRVLGVGLLSS
jgi:hypothetical protein